MTLLSTLALIGALFILAVTPGPAVFAIVARALASGVRQAALLVLGVILGDLVFLVLAIYGLAALAEQLNELFVVIKYIGGGYLIWLGLKLWFSPPANEEQAASDKKPMAANLSTGLFITLSNPKVILFYLGFLPTFVDLQTLTTADIGIIVLAIFMVLGAVFLGYAYIAGKAQGMFKSQRAGRVFNRSAGGVMIATGCVLLSRSES